MSTKAINRSVMAASLTAVMAGMAVVPAQALPIRAPDGQASYDALSIADKTRFINLMIDDTIQLLLDEGKREMAKRVHDLFVADPGQEVPLGMRQLYQEIGFHLKLQEERAAQGNTKVAHVQHAMLTVLERNKIDIPANVTRMARSFKPSDPLVKPTRPPGGPQ